MFSIFFLAILLKTTVLALGDNSGVDAENATTLQLINGIFQAEPFKLVLNHYNTYDTATNQYQFHGILEMQIATTLHAFDMGFCIQIDKESNGWDCYTN